MNELRNVYAISDLHLSFSSDKPMFVFGPVWNEHWEKISLDWDARVKEEDIVLIPGDLSWATSLDEAKKDIQEISKRKGQIIFIRGNHDYWCSSSTGISKIREKLPPNMNILRYDAIEVGNYVFCGTRGWMVPEKYQGQSDTDKKIFNRELQRMKMSLEKGKEIKKDGQILIVLIHYPPFNSSFEDSAFTNLFEEYGVNSVVYGHIHGNTSRVNLFQNKNGINYYLTSCDIVENKLIKIY